MKCEQVRERGQCLEPVTASFPQIGNFCGWHSALLTFSIMRQKIPTGSMGLDDYKESNRFMADLMGGTLSKEDVDKLIERKTSTLSAAEEDLELTKFKTLYEFRKDKCQQARELGPCERTADLILPQVGKLCRAYGILILNEISEELAETAEPNQFITIANTLFNNSVAGTLPEEHAAMLFSAKISPIPKEIEKSLLEQLMGADLLLKAPYPQEVS